VPRLNPALHLLDFLWVCCSQIAGERNRGNPF
jgi:hypothetical protein